MIDFGFCEFMRVSQSREIEVFNKLPCKMEIFWTI